MSRFCSFVLAMALGLGTGSVAHASETDRIELTRQVIETQHQAIVAEAMQLTDEQSGVFWPLYREYHAEMRAVNDQYLDIMMRYVNAYPDGLGDDVATDLMMDWAAMEADSIAIRKKYLKKFNKVLPSALVLRFFQIENKLTSIVRAEVAVQIPLN